MIHLFEKGFSEHFENGNKYDLKRVPKYALPMGRLRNWPEWQYLKGDKLLIVILIIYDPIRAFPIRPTDSDATTYMYSLDTTENSLIYTYRVCESLFSACWSVVWS